MDEPSMALPSLCGAGLRYHPNHQPAGHDIFMVEQNANGARDRRPRLCPANRANLHGHWNVDVVFRFARDSSLEGGGFQLPVPVALGEAARARQGEITDPLPRSSLSPTAIRQLLVLASNPKNLNRSPKRQDVQLFFFLSLPVAGCPNGGGFLVNGHDVDVRRNYSVASTCHTGV